MVTGQANKGSSRGIKGLLKPNSGLLLTQECKGNSQANSGPVHADKGPSNQQESLSGRQNAILGLEGTS